MIERAANKCLKCNETLEQFKTEDKLLKVIYSLSDRQYKILLHRYVEKKTLSEVGTIYVVTRERIRNIEFSTFKSIRMICKARGFEITEQEIIDFIWENRESLAWVIKKEILCVDASTSREKPVKEISRFTNKIKQMPDGLLSLPIESLELSVRANNCLIAAGIKTVREILFYSDTILTIKNLGRKSVRDIEESIRAAGLEIDFNVPFVLDDFIIPQNGYVGEEDGDDE